MQTVEVNDTDFDEIEFEDDEDDGCEWYVPDCTADQLKTLSEANKHLGKRLNTAKLRKFYTQLQPQKC